MRRNYYRWDKESGTMVELGVAERTLPEVNAPYVISDSMDAVQHPVNGMWVDSKSMMRRMARAAGCDNRTGAEKVADNVPIRHQVSDDDYGKSVKEAIEQVRSGNAPLNEFEREKCKRMNEILRNRV